MTSIATTPIIKVRSNRHDVAVATQRNTTPTPITSGFSIYISTFLTPTATAVLVNPHMTRFGPTTIISNCPNRHDSTVTIQRNAPPAIIISGFSIYISTLLIPSGSSTIPLINPHMTRSITSSIVKVSCNRHDSTIITQRNAPPAIILRCFAVYISTPLHPSATTPSINSHMTSIRPTIIIPPRPNRHNSTVAT